MGEFQPGDPVNVTIKGVEVKHVNADGLVVILDEHDMPYVLPPQAAIERAQPANWPPLVGDLWAGSRDRTPVRFVGIDKQRPLGEPAAALISDGGCEYDIDDVAESFGPLRLLYRDGGDT